MSCKLTLHNLDLLEHQGELPIMYYIEWLPLYTRTWLTEKAPRILVVVLILVQYERMTKSRAVVGHTALYINRTTYIIHVY